MSSLSSSLSVLSLLSLLLHLHDAALHITLDFLDVGSLFAQLCLEFRFQSGEARNFLGDEFDTLGDVALALADFLLSKDGANKLEHFGVFLVKKFEFSKDHLVFGLLVSHGLLSGNNFAIF